MMHTPDTPSRRKATAPLRPLIWICCGMALYGWLWPQAPLLGSDSYGYQLVAQDLGDGSWDQLTLRTVGYPILLLLTGSAQEPSRLLFYFGLLLHFLAVWILATTLRRLEFPSKAIGLFSILACLPPFVEPAAVVLTENLSQFLIVVAFCVALRALGAKTSRRSLVNALVCGLVLGIAAVVRPSFQAAGLALGGCFAILALHDSGSLRKGRRTLAAGTVVAAASLIVILSYSTVSWARFGHFGLAPGTLGYSLSTKTSKVLERLPERYAAEREILIQKRDANLVERGSSHTGEQFLPGAKGALSAATGLEGLALEDHILKLNVLLIREAPLHFLWESLRSVVTFWFPNFGSLSSGASTARQMVWTALHFALLAFFLIQLVAVTGGVLLVLTGRFLSASGRSQPWHLVLPYPETASYLLAGCLVLYTMAISCGLHHGESRYRSPVDLLVLLLCWTGSRLVLRQAARYAQADSDPERIL